MQFKKYIDRFKLWRLNNRKIKWKDLAEFVCDFEEHKTKTQKAIDSYMMMVVSKNEYGQLKLDMAGLKRSITTQKTAIEKIKVNAKELQSALANLIVDTDKNMKLSFDHFKEIKSQTIRDQKEFKDLQKKIHSIDKSLNIIYQYEKNMDELLSKETTLKELATDSIKEFKEHAHGIRVMHNQFKDAMAIQCKQAIGQMREMLDADKGRRTGASSEA